MRAPRQTTATVPGLPALATDPLVTARLGLMRASRTEAALDIASVIGPSAAELLSVQPAAARVLFCAPRIQAMARISTPAEEAERTKAEKARKANAASLWHTHSADQLQLFVFTAWQVIIQETPDTALLGLQLGLAANWHIADPEDFANQGPFLLNRQEGARLFMSLEKAALACSRAKPPGSLSSALVAQVKSNLIQFFRLRAQAVLPWCEPPRDTPHRRDVSLIARAIVAQASGVRRAFDYAQQAIAELCTGRSGDPQTENAAFLAMARPFYEAYLRNGMSNVLAASVVKQSLAFEPPPFLAAASGDTAVAWQALLAYRADPAPAGGGGPAVFPRLVVGPGSVFHASATPMSTQMVREAVRRMAAICQGDPAHFSGISARKGGLTTAISAGVPEEIVYLQSGHGQTRAARAYMHLQDPALLFATYQAFGL